MASTAPMMLVIRRGKRTKLGREKIADMQLKTDHLEGALLRSRGSRHGDKVFWCSKGKRHWITDGSWISEHGFHWPDSVIEVEPPVLDAFKVGSPFGRSWQLADWHSPPRDSVIAMRELAVSRLFGHGIEIGAGASPMPIPSQCKVMYVDELTSEELDTQAYEGQVRLDLVAPDIVAKFENLSAVADDSIDFVVACHVIEHTRDPIGAIAGAWKKIRPGGSVVLVVPEISRTFDRSRELTELEHLVEDFQTPDPLRLRDIQHFKEFYSKAFPTPVESFDHTWKTKWSENFSIHYHTWTHPSFCEMVRWMEQNGLVPGLEAVWSQPPLDESFECVEFWVVLRKSRDIQT